MKILSVMQDVRTKELHLELSPLLDKHNVQVNYPLHFITPDNRVLEVLTMLSVPDYSSLKDSNRDMSQEIIQSHAKSTNPQRAWKAFHPYIESIIEHLCNECNYSEARYLEDARDCMEEYLNRRNKDDI